jgi:hypothetical protein
MINFQRIFESVKKSLEISLLFLEWNVLVRLLSRKHYDFFCVFHLLEIHVPHVDRRRLFSLVNFLLFFAQSFKVEVLIGFLFVSGGLNLFDSYIKLFNFFVNVFDFKLENLFVLMLFQ